MSAGKGPPDETVPPGFSRGQPPSSPPTPATAIVAEAGESDSKGLRRQWRPEGAIARRRLAAARLQPLDCPGRCRDPLTECPCEIYPAPPSDKMVDGALQAAHHLRDAGLTPIFDLPTLRALWRSGHHKLVDELRGGAA
jgi:hypothetical protein